MSDYEIELKFPISDSDLLRKKLLEIEAAFQDIEQHRDTYYNHPCRDFAETNEALRIRRIDGSPLITYKGPKLPGRVKTRIEQEWPLGEGDPDGSKTESLLVHLGFRRVAEVIKRRESFTVAWHRATLNVTIDEVDQLGTFAEIECLAGEDRLDEACANVTSLAENLGLKNAEPRSYLRMLLEI